MQNEVAKPEAYRLELYYPQTWGEAGYAKSIYVLYIVLLYCEKFIVLLSKTCNG